MYWSTFKLLLHQGIYLVSSTFMLRYQEVLERIQFACSVILTMTYSGNLMTQYCFKKFKLSDWKKCIRKQRVGIETFSCRVGWTMDIIVVSRKNIMVNRKVRSSAESDELPLHVFAFHFLPLS